jgi:LPS export ABC transporter permease LptF/LPS export ABC transporter permease LptG
MRLIDRYLLREVVPYVALTFVLLTTIIFWHQSSRFFELLVVYSRWGLPMKVLGRLVAALIPGIVVFTLPISLLIGILVGMGRLSGDSEIVAMGASGISRLQVLKPMIALALFVAGAMLYLTFYVWPQAIHRLKDLKSNQSVLFQGLKTQIKPRVFEESIPHKLLYVEDIDRASGVWHNVFLVDLADQDHPKIMTASSGSLSQDERSENPELHLEQGSSHEISKAAANDADKQAGLADKDKERKKPTDSYTVTTFGDVTIGMEVSQENEAEIIGLNTDQGNVTEMDWPRLISYPARESHAAEYLNWLAEVHQRVAFPAACIVFAILAVGFGISHVRTGRSFGLILGLAITIIFYLLALSGRHAAVSGKVPVWLGIWLANLVLGGLGLFILWVQRRPGADALSAIGSLRHMLRRPDKGESDPEELQESIALAAAPALADGHRIASGRGGPGRVQAVDIAGAKKHRTHSVIGGFLRDLRQHQLIDRMVLSDLTRNFVFILAGFSALFQIITVFQLLDAITRNNIEFSVVASYLLFLMPMVISYMAPLAALVSVMVTFGLLEKTSQVIVLKASGISIYRLAAPALAASFLLSAVVFLNGDYVLPFTNRRQDNLYHRIRSGQEPAQTFFQTDHKWIFGGETRVYNYAHFNPVENTFANFTVLDLSKQPYGIASRIFARRATWEPDSSTWLLQDGWERRFDGSTSGVQESFKRRRVQLREHPEYFKKDSRESSMLTLAELRANIRDLARSGFDVLDLKIDLYRKIASPMTCVVMMIVGLPFAFSVGKKGALYGVTIGIAIGLIYFGLFSLSEQMGRYELLPPLLAAWAPNIMFGAGGLYLFLTSRT